MACPAEVWYNSALYLPFLSSVLNQAEKRQVKGQKRAFSEGAAPLRASP